MKEIASLGPDPTDPIRQSRGSPRPLAVCPVQMSTSGEQPKATSGKTSPKKCHLLGEVFLQRGTPI